MLASVGLTREGSVGVHARGPNSSWTGEEAQSGREQVTTKSPQASTGDEPRTWKFGHVGFKRFPGCSGYSGAGSFSVWVQRGRRP